MTRAFALDDIRILDRAQGGDGRTVEAYAAVFNRPAEIMDQDGHYNEQIHPNAFHQTLQQRRGHIFCVYNHARTLGGTPSDRWSVPLGTPLDMRTDAKGWLTVTRYNPDPDADRILEAIRSGSLKGMSFTGVFLRSDPELHGMWDEYGPNRNGELPLVTRLEIAAIEYGPTPIPAYDDAQVIAIRSADADPGREVIRVLTPDLIRAMAGEAGRSLGIGTTPGVLAPQLTQGNAPAGILHPDVQAAPPHDSGPLVTPDDPAQAKWDAQQWLNGMVFPADLQHMHSVYALYDTAGQFADGTFPQSAGFLPHHVVDGDGRPGPAHPDAVRAALQTLPALPFTDEAKTAARKHLESHMDKAGSEIDISGGSQSNATNGSGTGTLAAVVPTSSAGRDDQVGYRERTALAHEYAWAVVEISGGDPQAVFGEAFTRGFELAAPAEDASSRGGDAPGNGKLPYGNVEYADPGYQADKKKRYPLDTDEHVTAAWGYINQKDNAAKYSSDDLAKVKGKIKAAMKKHGHDVSDDDASDGKKSTSSSGRQPATQDAQERTTGTGPAEGAASTAAPRDQTHPAPASTDGSSTGSATMDGPMKVAERTRRLGEIQDRMKVIHALAPDGDLPAEFAEEWKNLAEEKSRHETAIKDASERAAMIAQFSTAGGDGAAAPDPAATEGTGNSAGFTGGDGAAEAGGTGGSQSRFSGRAFHRRPERDMEFYDPELIAQRSTNALQARRGLRDRAMQVIEEGSFPSRVYHTRPEDGRFAMLTREDCQDRVASLIDAIDGGKTDPGLLARRIIATGNPVYEEAFGLCIERRNVVGLSQAQARALELGIDSYGGYAVPYQLDPTIILTSNGAINPIRQLARVETITGKEWDGVTSAGVVVSRALEGTEVGTGDAQLIQPTVRTTRVQGFVPFSIELDVSWGALRSQMTALLMDAKDIEEASSFLLGNGTAPNPNGLITGLTGQYSIGGINNGSNSTVQTAGTAALAVADLYSLENAMPPRFRQQSAYLASRTIYNKFRQLFQALASAAFDSWVRPSAGQPATFNGYPAYEASPMSTSIASGNQVLVQGDYRQFLIVDRVGMGIELIPHLFGPTNRYPVGERGILAIWFNNSQVLVPNAFRVLQTT